MAQDPAQFEDDKVYLLTGATIKQLVKIAGIKGVEGEIAVEQRGKDLFVGFASSEEVAMIVGGVAGFYSVPAQLLDDSDEEVAKEEIKAALGIVDPVLIPVRAASQGPDGSWSMVDGFITQPEETPEG